ncbi:MAG: glycosyltransferase [Candidatus Omnitrophota bacterium]
MRVDPSVSVIIPAYNAAKTIGDAIRAVLSQDYAGQVDLIVVDDGSSDHTEDIVRSFPGVVYVHQCNAGPASARNRGAREACGEFLFFTDSDCRPESSWISKMLKGFLYQDVAVVAGSYGIANPHSALARVIHQEIVYRHRVLMPDYPKAFGSYNFAVRKEFFEAVGGFNPSYRRASGEDNDLSYKIIARGGRILFLKHALVDHYHQQFLGRYLREQYFHGLWRVKMYSDHPGMLTGDGYTFWKDIVEVPLVLLHVLSLIVPAYFLVLLACFLVFEIIFGCLIMRSCGDGVLAGGVMWLRSFLRTTGFFSGGLLFLLNKFKFYKKK